MYHSSGVGAVYCDEEQLLAPSQHITGQNQIIFNDTAMQQQQGTYQTLTSFISRLITSLQTKQGK